MGLDDKEEFLLLAQEERHAELVTKLGKISDAIDAIKLDPTVENSISVPAAEVEVNLPEVKPSVNVENIVNIDNFKEIIELLRANQTDQTPNSILALVQVLETKIDGVLNKKAPTYRHTVFRDSSGFIQSITSTPINE